MTISSIGAGHKVRRMAIFEKLDKSPDSGPSRMLIINSNKYGLTLGSYNSEYIELTPKGKQATDLKYLDLLKVIGGAERVIRIDHAIELMPQIQSSPTLNDRGLPTVDLVQVTHDRSIATYENFENICFYISPIGDEDSDYRKHSDLFLGSIVEPALEPLGLVVKRADQIDKPGIITKQVIEYIYKSKLVIADLSFHNPNVFYELALRHMFRLPFVQIIRKADKVPFDLNQTRTIVLDTTDIYTLVPRLETYKSEISSQVRQALNDPDSVDNPVTNVFPKLTFSLLA